MVTPIVGLQAEVKAQSAPELRILMYPDYWTQFQGTRAQLEAEGLIPPRFKWPSGTDACTWEVETGMTYRLRRQRPEGHKGAMRTWLGLDHWSLSIETSPRWRRTRRLEKLVGAFEREVYCQSAAWAKEFNAKMELLAYAARDQNFQAFKALVPGLIPPKPAQASPGLNMGPG